MKLEIDGGYLHFTNLSFIFVVIKTFISEKALFFSHFKTLRKVNISKKLSFSSALDFN